MSPVLKKILYVEDEKDIQTIVKISLEDIAGYELKVCSSGQEALEVAAEFLPDCLLLDVMMPEMDGPNTLSALRKIPEIANVPAIFMTAKAQVHEIENYNNFSIAGIITKPFDPMSLPNQLKKLWEKNL